MRRFTDEQLLDLALRDNEVLEVAHGWVGLAMYAEAVAEISSASAFSKSRADFLEIHAYQYSQQGRWREELQCADAMISDDPDYEFGYGFRADAIFHLHGAWAAYEDFAKAIVKFPTSPLLRFNLACYAAVAGRLFTARKNLIQMFRFAEQADSIILFRNLAQTDVELRPLWPEVFRAKEIASRLNRTKVEK